MSPLVKKLVEAQKHAMSIRPKVGGFPILAEVLRQVGVTYRATMPLEKGVSLNSIPSRIETNETPT